MKDEKDEIHDTEEPKDKKPKDDVVTLDGEEGEGGIPQGSGGGPDDPPPPPPDPPGGS